MRSLYLVSLPIIFLGLVVALPVLSQNIASDLDIEKIQLQARRSINDYQILMNSLADPNNNQKYILAEYLDEARQYFTDSAMIENDYEPHFLPPNLPSEVVVEKYLRDFYLFYQKKSLDERIRVYYDQLEVSPVQWSDQWSTNILTVSFNSAYGNQLPHKRVATFRADKQAEEWVVRMTYIKFQRGTEDSAVVSEKTVALPEWQEFAQKAEDSLDAKDYNIALMLIEKSIELDTNAINLKLRGRYYEEQFYLDEKLPDLENALENYVSSLQYGKKLDENYNDTLVASKVRELKILYERTQVDLTTQDSISTNQLAETNIATEEKDPEVEPSSAIFLNDLNKKGKRGKVYHINWQIPESQPVDLLVTGKGRQWKVKEDIEENSADFQLSKALKPGKYHLTLNESGNDIHLAVSESFRINRKFPLALKVGLGLAIGGALFYDYQNKLFLFKEKTIDPGLQTTERKDIVAPPTP